MAQQETFEYILRRNKKYRIKVDGNYKTATWDGWQFVLEDRKRLRKSEVIVVKEA